MLKAKQAWEKQKKASALRAEKQRKERERKEREKEDKWRRQQEEELEKEKIRLEKEAKEREEALAKEKLAFEAAKKSWGVLQRCSEDVQKEKVKGVKGDVKATDVIVIDDDSKPVGVPSGAGGAQSWPKWWCTKPAVNHQSGVV